MVARMWFGVVCVGLICALPAVAQEAPDELAPDALNQDPADGPAASEIDAHQQEDDEGFGGEPTEVDAEDDAAPEGKPDRTDTERATQGESAGDDPLEPADAPAGRKNREGGASDSDAAAEARPDDGEFVEDTAGDDGPGIAAPVAGAAVGVAMMGLFGVVVGGASGLSSLLTTLAFNPNITLALGWFSVAGMLVGCLTLPAGIGAGVNLTANAISGYEGSYLYTILTAYLSFYALGAVMLAANFIVSFLLIAVFAAIIILGADPQALGIPAVIAATVVSSLFGAAFSVAVPAATAGVWYATANSPNGKYEADIDDEGYENDYGDEYDDDGYDYEDEPYDDDRRAAVFTPVTPSPAMQAY